MAHVALVPPTTPQADVPSLFADERARLIELLDTFEPGDWLLPSPCPEWTVLDLCAHLVGDDVSLVSRHRDGYLGTPAPDGLAEPQFIEWLDELQMEWVRAARRLSPRLVIELLGWLAPQLVGAMRGQDPTDRSASVSWASTDAVPIWVDQVRELSEYWIHRQQLLTAVDRPSDLDAPTLGAIFEGFRWAYPYRLNAIASMPDDTVTIEIDGPVARSWLLVATGDGWGFTEGPESNIVGRLAMSTDQAWRLLTNNLAAGEQRELDVSGDPEVVQTLLQTRAIIGTPR